MKRLSATSVWDQNRIMEFMNHLRRSYSARLTFALMPGVLLFASCTSRSAATYAGKESMPIQPIHFCAFKVKGQKDSSAGFLLACVGAETLSEQTVFERGLYFGSVEALIHFSKIVIPLDNLAADLRVWPPTGGEWITLTQYDPDEMRAALLAHDDDGGNPDTPCHMTRLFATSVGLGGGLLRCSFGENRGAIEYTMGGRVPELDWILNRGLYVRDPQELDNWRRKNNIPLPLDGGVIPIPQKQ